MFMHAWLLNMKFKLQRRWNTCVAVYRNEGDVLVYIGSVTGYN